MNRVFFFLTLLLCGYQTLGQQFPSQVWHSGKIVLIEGDTLKGQIRYSQETDIVEYTKSDINVAIAFTAQKLLYFEIFDQTLRRYREFYALPFAVHGGDYKTPLMFEVIHEGAPYSLLSREKVEYRAVNHPYAVAGTFNRLELVYDYYFLDKEGEIIRFYGARRDLPYVFKRKSQEIKKYVKANKIRPDRRSDLIRVVAYYNSLFEEKTASN